ncbi:NYN domain-containing protein [Nocardioides sp.]|uniref:NYN domain-containing protein n=1 Tax=Nocardioides sp. TaxID=35761 RepID=UPI003D13A189
MASIPDSTRLAVLIDGDNTTSTIVEALLAEIAKYGSATVKRVYGDWTTPSLRGWKEVINAHAIQPIQQFAYTTGKNATDSALIIDAMDLLYTGNLDGFCLVTSDSDFTRLASRLRESGKTVYGFGEPRTPRSLVAACNRFVFLDVLRPPEEMPAPSEKLPVASAPVRKSETELRSDTKLVKLLRDGINAGSDDDGWANLSGVGNYVAKQQPAFDSRNWGYAKLVDLVTTIGLFEVKRTSGQGVRLRENPKRKPAKKSPPKAPVSNSRDRASPTLDNAN